MLPIRAGVLSGALLFAGAAPLDQAAPTVTVSCKTDVLEAAWSGTDSLECIAKPVLHSPSANLKMSCLAPGGMTCEVHPALTWPRDWRHLRTMLFGGGQKMPVCP